MKLLKFGGKSLANGEGINNVISIIESKVRNKDKIVVVVSARGNTTDRLEGLLDLAKSDKDYQQDFELFKAYQTEPITSIDLKNEFELIGKLLKGVRLTGDYSLKVKDTLLAQGELISAKTLSLLLNSQDVKSTQVDSRLLLRTDDNFGDANVDSTLSEESTIKYFHQLPSDSVPIVTGFIASNEYNETTTLGRNGTNYSASLLANFLGVKEIESYTHVDGIFTANPETVRNAKVINHISYNEASELASFGASILHSKSINPLIDKNISLRILNTFNKENTGTLISNEKTSQGIKSISIKDDVALINITGKGLMDKKGIDARLFSSLSNIGISVGIISQGSSERGVSFIIPKRDSVAANKALSEEFKHEFLINDIQSIKVIDEVAVLTIVGQHIGSFASSLDYLKQNKIDILLINNTISGNNISIIINKKDVKKATNVIHSQVFGAIKRINIAVVGKGTVGGSLINQILASKQRVLDKKSLDLNVFAIAGSKKILLNKDGISQSWQDEIQEVSNSENHTSRIIQYAEDHHLENLIIIDNTSSELFVDHYADYIENGFDLISSNKIANTQQFKQYKSLRECLKKHNKHYLYETNVGAGLPIIDTIRILHESGENITRIRGVFSGTLSYLFNSFSEGDKPISFYLNQAIKLGYTEPDPRDDLSGKDVARKLLILARELDLENELEEIDIQNLIPASFRKGSAVDFIKNMERLDEQYKHVKEDLEEGQVLRYVGNLGGNLQKDKGELKVSLVAVSKESALGNLKGSDSIFEIYTESYKENPITIIGAGAGAEVTARGVFGDLLRIAEKK